MKRDPRWTLAEMEYHDLLRECGRLKKENERPRIVRSAAIVKTADREVILRIIYENNDIGYKKLTRLDLLHIISDATTFLVEDECERNRQPG